MMLWYEKPAAEWSQALPVGNGRLGGMMFGGVARETIQLNEDSVWSGKRLDRINPDAKENLPVIRRLLREGKLREAQRLAMYALSGTPNSQRAYQTAGEWTLNFWNPGDVTDYRRELDLDAGAARVSFRTDGVTYRRELIASCPDDVLALRLWTEEGAPFSFDCLLGRKRNFTDEVGRDGGDGVHFVVDAPKGGISFCAAVKVKAAGGSIRVIGEHIVAKDVTEAVLILDIQTSFRRERILDAADRCGEALKKSWEALYQAHRADYREHFSTLSLYYGRADAAMEAYPTDVRLKNVQDGGEDMGLLELYFQFGRYLLFSSSRAGSLPANLQGIWNDSLTPAWDSKFTININTEMNYWIAESGNLSACHLPLFDLLERMKESGKETARRMYGCRGSVAHHNTDLYADTAPQDHWPSSTFWVMGEAWLATHIWEHYLYTNDRTFLEEHFDVLRQCVLFFEDFLTENEAGELVVSPSISPENTYRTADGTEGVLCEGSAMDAEILEELFGAYLEAGKILGEDAEALLKAERTRERFPGRKIGKYGQLLEWTKDYEETEPGHRHISHLYGVYPGSSISREKTPALMDAALTTLKRRLANGGGHTGWSRAWIIGFWAAFGDGAMAYENLRAILSMGTFPNLMDTHPMGSGHVFQIDGNLGAAAAMLEMLAQCRDGRIVLLPAVTRETGSGEVRGMRLRGGIGLSMKWEDEKVTALTLTPDKLAGESLRVSLAMNGEERIITLPAGQDYHWERTEE